MGATSRDPLLTQEPCQPDPTLARAGATASASSINALRRFVRMKCVAPEGTAYRCEAIPTIDVARDLLRSSAPNEHARGPRFLSSRTLLARRCRAGPCRPCLARGPRAPRASLWWRAEEGGGSTRPAQRQSHRAVPWGRPAPRLAGFARSAGGHSKVPTDAFDRSSAHAQNPAHDGHAGCEVTPAAGTPVRFSIEVLA